MENNFYSQLLNPQTCSIEEPKSNYCAITERHIQILWFEQKYFRSLTTEDGLPISVISPGIWNGEAGPDFKKAHLRIGDQEIKGDVEIHLTDAGWTQHKHHLDAGYENVVFHLSLWKPKNDRDLFTNKGTKLIRSYMEPCLNIPLARIVKLVDTDLYPYYQYTGSGQCSEQLFGKISEKETLAFFRSAAEWRLRIKNERLKTFDKTPNEALLRGISQVLGYKNNSKAFSKLYDSLALQKTTSEKELLAYAMGVCGFFDDAYQIKWDDSTYYTELKNLHLSKNPVVEKNIELNLHQIRPFNHPVRRLAYLVKLLCDPKKEFLFDKMVNYWNENWQEGLDSKRKIDNLIPFYDDMYWNKYYTFSSKPSNEYLPLTGNNFFKNVLVNNFLPLLYDIILKENNPAEIEAFWIYFRSVASNGSGKSQYLSKRFFGNSKKTALFKTTLIEQGAFQLHNDFCIRFEASCDGCPFVGRYLKKPI